MPSSGATLASALGVIGIRNTRAAVVSAVSV
jgi:hypothetical protein